MHDAGVERVGRDGEVREPVLRMPLEDGAELELGPRDRQVERGPSYETVEGTRRDVSEVDPTMAGAAGGDAWITTTRDTATFLAALWAGRPFARPESTRAAMLGFVEASLPEEAQTGYGLGLARFHFGGRGYVGHLGGTAGSQSFMLVDTTSGAVLTGAMTTRGDLGAFLVPVLEAMGSVR